MPSWSEAVFRSCSPTRYEDLLQVVGVPEEVGRGNDRPGRDLVRDVLGRDVAHLEIAALHRDEFGALLEQRAAVVGLQREADGFDVLPEALHHLRPDVLLGEDG